MKSRFSSLQLVVFLSFFSILALVSCKKETSQDGTAEAQEVMASRVSGESDAQSEIIFNEVFDNAFGPSDEVGIYGTGVFGRLTACPNVTVIHLTSNQFPIRVILDFGANGCLGNDGHYRRGKIITDYTQRLLVPGAMATTTFDNFFYDSIKVEGTHKIKNTGSPVNVTPVVRKFDVDVINGKLTFPSTNFVEWDSHKVITMLEGLLTPVPIDDVFKVEGSSTGKTKRGNLLVAWQSTITEPLIKRFNCRWIVKGRIRTIRATLNSNSPWVAILDFGAGQCDNHAVVNINGVSHQITLP